jgi:hypothetical protein
MIGRATACRALATALALLPSAASAVTLDSLQGAVIEASSMYNTHIRLDGREFDAQTRWSVRMSIGGAGAFNASFVRVGIYQGREMGSLNRSLAGTIGTPQQAGKGHSVWLLSGDKLILLRTFEAGGFKAEISLSADGKSCSLRAPLAREVGAGNTRMQSAARPGSQVEVLTATQTSSTCKVSR